ncbi:MAG TPA: nuclear transport factor 2 family protein [Solirubrobacteraceae bacterium]|jgi:ketosteroid isomerase-like protein|nr:nuclear transport factor 2 family protein [Solirubrobacteraceae bacterium]
MSEENVGRVRAAVEAWNSRDAELWTEYAAPEVEWMPAGPAAVEGSVYRGREQVAAGLRSVWEAWDVVSFEESEIRDLDETVLWLGRLKLRGAASHVELDQEFAVRFVLREGKLLTVQAFTGWRQGLGAVGLSE